MKMLESICVILLAFSASINAKKLPSYVKVCHQSGEDPEKCFADAINSMKPFIGKGISEIGIPPLDPLKVTKLSLDSGSGGSFGISLEMTDVSFIGLENTIINTAKIDKENVILEISAFSTRFDIQSHYAAKGRILVIPIDGSGELEFVFNNVTLFAKWGGEKITKNGKEYFKFGKSKEFHIDMENGRGEFGSLFKNNQQLTDSTNQVFNDNFNVAFQEFKPSIELVLAEVLMNICNSVHERVPVDDLYPE